METLNIAYVISIGVREIFAVREQWSKISLNHGISSLVISQEMQFPTKLLNIDFAQLTAESKRNFFLF